MNDYTTPTYWNNVWERAQAQYITQQSINNQLIKLIKPVLFRGSKILEIGCVPAGRLYFLWKHFGTVTYGLDYSLKGLFNSVKNGNHLVCSELFYPPFREGSFDLVYSLGVIEHFHDPAKVIDKHIELARNDGLILITVPNFSQFSLLSTVIKLAGGYEEIQRTHNMSIMNIDYFTKLFERFRLDFLLCDYYGPPGILSPPNPFIRRICAKINRFVDRVAFRSKFFSPDIVFVGRKL